MVCNGAWPHRDASSPCNTAAQLMLNGFLLVLLLFTQAVKVWALTTLTLLIKNEDITYISKTCNYATTGYFKETIFLIDCYLIPACS